ncbi:MAG TPA: SRPBCC domain-containing protein [Phycisphaerales bacterium]|nr:SRPBCC domain-containing protein [Phycisphaerales bacterium]
MTASVTTSVLINADQTTVWKFLSEQQRVLGWMTYMPGAPAPAGSVFEARPGGALRIIFPNGGEAKGKVLEVRPPERLVFTWGYAPDVAKTGLGPGACRVEISVRRVEDGSGGGGGGGGTLVTLTHSGPMSEALAQGHLAGWNHYLSQLAVQSAMEFHQSHLGATLENYFNAWSEADAGKRDALLAGCCEPNVRFRSAFACTETRADMSAHIANGLAHMPGMRLQQDGIARHMHGVARVPWKVAGPDGKAAFRGENIVRFTPSGLISELISFPA